MKTLMLSYLENWRIKNEKGGWIYSRSSVLLDYVLFRNIPRRIGKMKLFWKLAALAYLIEVAVLIPSYIDLIKATTEKIKES